MQDFLVCGIAFRNNTQERDSRYYRIIRANTAEEAMAHMQELWAAGSIAERDATDHGEAFERITASPVIEAPGFQP